MQTSYQSTFSSLCRWGLNLLSDFSCCPKLAEEEVNATGSLIEKTEGIRNTTFESSPAAFTVHDTLLLGANQIRYCLIDNKIELLGLERHIAEWKVKEANLPSGQMPKSIQLTDTEIEWLPNTFDTDNLLRATDQYVILANYAFEADLAFFDRVSGKLLKSTTLGHIVKMEVDRGELFVFTLGADFRNYTLYCYDLSNLDSAPRILTNIFGKYLEVLFTDKEIILNIRSCFANSSYNSYYLIALTRDFDDQHKKLFNDADTELNFGNMIKFDFETRPHLVPYKGHFLACFFITDYNPASKKNETGEFTESYRMEVNYITITSDSIVESFLFNLNKKVWNNSIERVGLCGDRIFVMGDMAYVINMKSEAIEASLKLLPQWIHNGFTEWQFLSVANRVSYLYTSKNGPNITTIDVLG